MKRPMLFLGLAVAFLAGCDSVATRVHDRFEDVPPHTKVFSAGLKATYESAQAAVRKVGLLLGHTSAARWSVEGYAPIRAGDAINDARQTTIEVKLAEAPDGQTEVSVLIFDQVEGNYTGGTSKQALREHGLYEAYFAALQEVLAEKAAPVTAEKP